jgi:hypothetical protein
VLAGGVHSIPAAKPVYSAQYVVCAAGGDMIEVEGKNIASIDGVTLAPPASADDTTDEPADVFQAILLWLGKTQIGG